MKKTGVALTGIMLPMGVVQVDAEIYRMSEVRIEC
jgi:hypothetical protein